MISVIFDYWGQMGNRHIQVLADFMYRFWLPQGLRSIRILGVGVWTGGTSLLSAAPGAEIRALEEVKKYSNMVNYIALAFGLSNLNCRSISVYELDDQNAYDYIINSGVIYHVPDPVLALRILFNALKDGGRIFVETFGVNTDPEIPPMALIEGPVLS